MNISKKAVKAVTAPFIKKKKKNSEQRQICLYRSYGILLISSSDYTTIIVELFRAVIPLETGFDFMQQKLYCLV